MIQIVSETEDFNANTEYEEMFALLVQDVAQLQTDASEGRTMTWSGVGALIGMGATTGYDLRSRIITTDAEYDDALRAFLKATGLDKRGFVLGEMATPEERLRIKKLFRTDADAVRNSPLSKQLKLLNEFIAQIDDNGYVRPSFQNEIGDGDLKNRFDKLRTKYKDLPDWFENSEDLTAAQRKEMLAGFDDYLDGKRKLADLPEDLVAMRTYLHDHVDAITGRCYGYNFDFEFNAVVDDCGDVVLKQKLEAVKNAGIELPEECAIKKGEVLTPEKRSKMCSSICDLEAQYSKQASKSSGYSELEALNNYMRESIGSDGEYRLRSSSTATHFDTKLRISCASNGKNARQVLQQNIMAWNTSPEYWQYYPQEELAAMRELDYYMVQTLDENGTLRKTPGRVHNRAALPVNMGLEEGTTTIREPGKKARAVNRKATQKAQQQVRKYLVQPKRPVSIIRSAGGAASGFVGGGLLDYALAPETNYTPDLVDNGKISGLEGAFSQKVLDCMEQWHNQPNGPDETQRICQRLLDEDYIRPYEILGKALTYMTENKCSFSQYIQNGEPHRRIRAQFENIKKSLETIIEKAQEQGLLEKWGIQLTGKSLSPDQLAEDVALKMMDGVFYQLLLDIEKQIDKENTHSSDLGLLSPYGERYIDPLEDTVFPSDKYNSRQA